MLKQLIMNYLEDVHIRNYICVETVIQEYYDLIKSSVMEC